MCIHPSSSSRNCGRGFAFAEETAISKWRRMPETALSCFRGRGSGFVKRGIVRL